MLILIVYIIFLVTLILGIAILIKSKKKEILEKLIIGSLPAVSLSTATHYISVVLYAPFNSWNATRLIHCFTLVKGYKPYSLLGEGPAITSFYGPVPSIVYLITALSNSPTHAILIQVTLNVLFAVFPVACLLLAENFANKNKLVKFSVLAAFCLLILNSAALRNAIFLHVDSIALGLCCGACVSIHLYKNSKNNSLLLLSALFLALSVWAKYVMLPVSIVVLVYLYLTEDKQVSLRYGILFSISLGIVSFLFLWSFGVKEIIFNTVTAIACSFKQLACDPKDSCTWLELLEDKFEASLIFAQELLKENILSLGIILVFCASQFQGVGSSNSTLTLLEKIKQFFKENPWILWVMIGLFMIPIALSARQKEGGDINHYALVAYFLNIGALLIIKDILINDKWPLITKQIAQASLLSILLGLSLSFFVVPRILLQRFQQLENNPEEIAYKYLKTHPENVYFPERMIGTVMAIDKIYHTGEGIYPIVDCVGPQSKEYFHAYIPTTAEFIAFHPSDSRYMYMLRFLPEFNQRVELKDLPGWTVYKRNLPK